MIRGYGCLLALFLCMTVGCSSTLAADHDPPNVILIMLDDMGFSDIGCYGGEVETPNIDAIADRGVRYTRFYNAARCCPSRASLITGRYQHAVGMGWMTAVDEHTTGYRGQIASDQPTIAEILKANGYGTYMAGKWHVSVHAQYHDKLDAKPNGAWPTDRGFDEFFGGLSGGGDFYRPRSMAHNDKRIGRDDLPKDFYYTTNTTDTGLQYIREHQGDGPMFIYLAYYAPHRPLQAPQDRIDKVRARYEVGYDVLRAERFERMQAMGIIPADAEPGRPINNPPAWKDLPDRQKQQWIKEMATYAAMIEIVDDGIGQIVAELEQQGELDNTIFLFLSDNGATDEGPYVSRLAADLSNYPYIHYKKRTLFGGIASPLIVSWPAKWSSQSGELRHTPTHIIDLLPTIVDATGATPLTTFAGKAPTPPDGVSLVPTVYKDQLPQRPLFWEHEGNRAVMHGDWKAVATGVNGKWALYHLPDDPFEQQDVADQHPDKLAELVSTWHGWAEANHVLPLHHEGWNQRIKKYTQMHPDQSGTN